MKREEISLVSNLGRCLWTDPAQSGAITRETISAVTLLDSNPERAAEKAVQALLERANRKGMYARVATGLNALFPEERFLLLALHQGRWSYARIARVLASVDGDGASGAHATPDTALVQQLAWNARVYLALSHYPSAPKQSQANCPEYDPQRPWTQRFVDEELEGNEKLFLQSHLASCEDCREALLRTKEVYYRVQKQIEEMQTRLSQSGLTSQLQALVEEGRKVRSGQIDGAVTGAFQSLVARTDVRLVLLAWAVALVWLKFKH